jgi:hypothetical protein
MAHVIEYVKWDDHTTHTDWVDVEKIKTSSLKSIESVGWLVHETDKVVILSTSCDFESGDCLDPISIAKHLITERRTIRESKPRRNVNKKPAEGAG